MSHIVNAYGPTDPRSRDWVTDLLAHVPPWVQAHTNRGGTLHEKPNTVLVYFPDSEYCPQLFVKAVDAIAEISESLCKSIVDPDVKDESPGQVVLVAETGSPHYEKVRELAEKHKGEPFHVWPCRSMSDLGRVFAAVNINLAWGEPEPQVGPFDEVAPGSLAERIQDCFSIAEEQIREREDAKCMATIAKELHPSRAVVLPVPVSYEQIPASGGQGAGIVFSAAANEEYWKPFLNGHWAAVGSALRSGALG